ncbi:hypothetical protein [Sulfitobacter sp. TBRI5]|jgi:hypothetical protein|uniref:hypothetical protein n=1 Tax=Sulfitobacter sp. TBRI5 TaxID=2989732 RepID=UPI003D9B9635
MHFSFGLLRKNRRFWLIWENDARILRESTQIGNGLEVLSLHTKARLVRRSAFAPIPFGRRNAGTVPFIGNERTRVQA